MCLKTVLSVRRFLSWGSRFGARFTARTRVELVGDRLFQRYLPYLKMLAVACMLLGSGYVVLSALSPGGVELPLPDSVEEFLPGLEGDPGEEAVAIAVDRMTRVYSLQQRPPSGGEALGRTVDGRYWCVSLDLGPQRARIVCVVEPAARGDRKLVHHELSALPPSKEHAKRIASQGMGKVSRRGAEWIWNGAGGGGGGEATALRKLLLSG